MYIETCDLLQNLYDNIKDLPDHTCMAEYYELKTDALSNFEKLKETIDELKNKIMILESENYDLKNKLVWCRCDNDYDYDY